MLAPYAYITTMNEALGKAVKELRQKADLTLREFAKRVGISPAHQSDIEHGRRSPSEKKLKLMAELLSHVGASYEEFKKLDTRIDSDLSHWITNTPEASEMLREVKKSKINPQEVLKKLQELLESVENEREDESQ